MLVILYLSAIIAANLIVVKFGPQVSIITAFLLIGLDLTSRDGLHDKWHGKYLWWKMLLLISSGSLLSWFLNRNAAPIAFASFVAFSCTGLVDTLVYWLLGRKNRIVKINGSNFFSSVVDSLMFPVLAFGFPVLWGVVLGQFIAKVGGGFAWSIVLPRLFSSSYNYTGGNIFFNNSLIKFRKTKALVKRSSSV